MSARLLVAVGMLSLTACAPDAAHLEWTLGFAGLSAVPAAAFVGATGAVSIVYALARARHRGLSTDVLLLAGVTLNAFFSALILMVQYFADFADSYRTLRWLMGDLDVSSYQPLISSLPLIAIAFAAFAWLARPLNLLSLGTDSAETRGLEVVPSEPEAPLRLGREELVGGPAAPLDQDLQQPEHDAGHRPEARVDPRRLRHGPRRLRGVAREAERAAEARQELARDLVERDRTVQIVSGG